MIVDITHSLEEDLKNAGLSSSYIINKFKHWKTNWNINEYTVYDFGKDGGFRKPIVNNSTTQFRHVHLLPTEPNKLSIWNQAFKRGQRNGGGSKRTSDRVLVYVEDDNDYLLIAILPEPTAHKVMDMKTPQDKQTINYLAYVAEKYINEREIVA